MSEEKSERSPGMHMGGGYKLIKRIGFGASGEVWSAEAPGGIVTTAIRVVFRPIDQLNAQRELQALDLMKHLRHLYLLQIQAFWAMEDRLLIVMELADCSLRDRLKQCRDAGLPGIPLPELLRHVREAAEALDFLHNLHILHGDIKPSNILLLDGHAKVADFRCARVLPQTRQSRLANSPGTLAYMAPEVWNGELHEHTDQYALACTYAELRLGHPLFADRPLAQMMLERVQGRPQLEPLPQAEQDVLLKALAKDPDQRYPSCVAFSQALAQVVSNLDQAAPPATKEPDGPGVLPWWRRLGRFFRLS